MKEVEWQALRAEQLRELAGADAIVLFPVASTEQHGPHLATGVDDVLCREVCRRAALKLAGSRPHPKVRLSTTTRTLAFASPTPVQKPGS